MLADADPQIMAAGDFAKACGIEASLYRFAGSTKWIG
jgi:hypothetical protein